MRSRHIPFAPATFAALLGAASAARADILPPPTFVADFLYLGIPLGVLAALGLVVAAVVIYRRVRRSGRGRAVAALIAAAIYLTGNLGCYVLGLSLFRRRPHWEPPIPSPRAIDSPERPPAR